MDKWNSWMRIKCNILNFIDYQYLNGNDDPWFSLKYNSELFPFGTLNNKTFNQCPNMNSLFNEFNNLPQTHDFKDPQNVAK